MSANRRQVSLNLNVRGMHQSATLAIKERVRALRREGRHVYDLGLGQSPFPVPAPIVEALRLAAPEKDYQPVMGLPALREAVAEFHRRKDGIDRQPQDVLVGPGSKELMFLLQIAFYGEILLPTPCWVSYLPQARIIGRRISLIHASIETDWKITADQLRHSLEMVNDDTRPRVLVLNYPSNPVGNTYSEDELREIAEVAREFGIIILSDEIYGQLHFTGGHVSIVHFYPEGTIQSSGLSKWCGAGGWRLGTFTFPPDLRWLRDAMAAVASETFTSVSAPIQHAAVQAFHCGAEIERYLHHVRRILAALGSRCAAALRKSGVRIVQPEGAFYLFPDFSPHSDALASRGVTDGGSMCERLLEDAGVAALPGVSFGRSRGELTARLAYVDFDGARALADSEAIPLDQPLPQDFLDKHCGNVFEGVAKLCEWAASPTRRVAIVS
jgi:aspartate aminotransferase